MNPQTIEQLRNELSKLTFWEKITPSEQASLEFFCLVFLGIIIKDKEKMITQLGEKGITKVRTTSDPAVYNYVNHSQDKGYKKAIDDVLSILKD